MKMGFLFSGVFWGVVVIIIGISIIFKTVFKIDIPVFRIIIALIFIYAGIKIITGGFGKPAIKNGVFFGEANITGDIKNKEYNIIFAKGDIDLSAFELPDRTEEFQLNTVFGHGRLKINSSLPVRIQVNTAFAGVKLPNGNNVAFGEYFYETKAYKEGEKHLFIKASAVFGALEVIE